MILYGSRYGSVREYVSWIQGAAAGEAADTAGIETSAVAGADAAVIAGAKAAPVDNASTDAAPIRAYDLKKERHAARDALAGAPSEEPILILAPVYAGQIHRHVKSFVDEHVNTIRRHPLALGLTSLYQGEEAQEELMNCYPSALVAHASRQFLIGGRIRPAELPFPVRFIIQKITKSTSDIDTLKRDLVTDIVAWLRSP